MLWTTTGKTEKTQKDTSEKVYSARNFFGIPGAVLNSAHYRGLFRYISERGLLFQRDNKSVGSVTVYGVGVVLHIFGRKGNRSGIPGRGHIVYLIKRTIGKGNLNFAAIIPACDECGVEYVFIEQDNAPESDSMACVEYSLNTLKKMGGRF